VPLHIGTSGWQYRHWRGRFYARGLPTARWFDAYAEQFDTVELNVTFYRQPRPQVFDDWARRAPDGFLFAVKASRYLTHVRRLREPRDPVDYLLDGAHRLGSHLGPVLIQLPPDMRVEPDRLAETLESFPRTVRVAVEVRHDSWFTDEIREILGRREAALCWADRRGPLTPDWRTARWGYIRFHEGRARPSPCYGRQALSTWAGRVGTAFGASGDVFAYFNNDPQGCAVRDASIFAGLARRRGLEPGSVPATRQVPVG
jgi:uncharacterized protein YecE (DUF72 family)